MKVLIFTASAGSGHNVTANLLKKKQLQRDPDAEVKIVDIYKTYSNPLKAWAMSKGYALACNHFVKVYNYFFRKSENNSYETRNTTKANTDVKDLLYGMLKEIYDFKPDTVVCTYIFAAVALNNLRRYYDIPANLMIMTLDYAISPYWECTTSFEKMYLTGDYMIKPFLEKGFNEKQLKVLGIPLEDSFVKKEDKQTLRKEFGLKDKTTLLISRATFFPLSNKQLVDELKKIKVPIQIVIWNGKDEKGKQNLEKLLAKEKLPHDIKLLGYVDDLGKLLKCGDFILMKAGGRTTTEALASGLPMIILDNLPTQEFHNKEFLVSNGAALSVDKKHSISERINEFLENENVRNRLQENVKKLKMYCSFDDFIDEIESFEKPTYNHIKPLKDTKSQVKRNVNKKRKEAIKSEKKQKKAVKTQKI